MIKEAIISLLIGFLIGRLIHLNNTLLIEDLETLVLYGLIFVVGLGISIDESLPKKFRELSLETLIAPISSLTSSSPFRARVSRGLEGYTPLWVLLDYDPQ
jgi:uncharacterized membrane protein YbjE (DUF340 family)